MKLFKIIITIALVLSSQFGLAQLGDGYDIERPEKYAERKLGYEKTYTKKYKLPRKFIQNTISHYNFFFNANEKINNVIIAATEAQKDSFERLLPYFPFSLDFTKNQKNELDSAVQKATGGILLHDLRTNWVDNFYLIIGKAYFLKKQYDSAEMTFNYINYEFAPKDKDKERILSGSIDENNTAFSIANKEKKSMLHKAFQRPPSRNESFIWLIRTHIENKDFGSAAGLIQTLQSDPKFPKRLYNDLDEMTGYFYYCQNLYDSAAHYAAKGFSMAEGKADKARRQFLIGQLYALSGNNKLASDYYAKSVKNSLDPVMEVYARLYSIRLNNGSDPKVVQENIDALVKMGKKDAYQDYRDIIFYFAGQMELERSNKDAAVINFLKSAKNSGGNLAQKNKTYFALADIAYADKKYRDASNYYDSLDIGSVPIEQTETVTSKKTLLKQLVAYTDNIQVEDSLQMVSKMPTNERDDYLRKLVKRLRKEQGLKDEGVSFGNTSAGFSKNNSAPTSLFEPTSGDWYFYNNTAKSKGNNEFKQKWGNRPNIDNWRRSKAIANEAAVTRGSAKLNDPKTDSNIDTSAVNAKKMPKELTIEALEANLYTTPQQFTTSDSSIAATLWSLGNLYQFDFEDLPAAIKTYEELITRFSNNTFAEKAFFNLYLAYNKLGDTQQAEKFKAMSNPALINANKPKEEQTAAAVKQATDAYETIYKLFEQEQYDLALQKKKELETTLGVNEWTPQLSYLEACYYAKNSKDSLALALINSTLAQFPDTKILDKLNGLRNALSRRSQIEHDLQRMNVVRKTDTIAVNNNVTNNTTVKPPANTTNTTAIKKDTASAVVNKTTTPVANSTVVPTVVKKDTAVKTVAPAAIVYPYTWDANSKDFYVGIVLKNVEQSFCNELKNSLIVYNRTVGRTLFVEQSNVNAEVKIILLQTFANATDATTYALKTRQKAPTEIMPWLSKEKYSFIIIDKSSLNILIKTKDIDQYKAFLALNVPGSF